MIVKRLGLVEYAPALEAMRVFTAARGADTSDEIWLLQHPPVYTLGQAGKPEHLLQNPAGIPLVHIDRGGQITYHGPGQLVAYLLLGIILSIFLGVTLSAMNEMFTARVRMGGFSIGYNLSVSLFGGTAPYLMQALVTNTENLASPAFYLIVAALVTLPVILLSKETAPRKVGTSTSTDLIDQSVRAHP